MYSHYGQMRLLAIALGEALDKIRIPFEIIGSTTGAGGVAVDGFHRTNPIVYRHYKSFAEQWMAVRHRVAGIYCYNNNVDGEVVEYAAQQLQARPETRKVVFSLSDGRPMTGQGSNVEAARNLVRVCKRSREQGVEVFGFGVGTRAPEQFYGEDFFVYLNSATDMGAEFVRRFADIVTRGRVHF